MQVHVEQCFCPEVAVPGGYQVLARDGGVLLLPAMRGEPLVAAWWSDDGVHFVEAPIDGSAVELGSEPVVDVLNGHHWVTDVTADGRVLFWFNHHMVSATVGPRVVFEPVAYRSPVEWKFHLEDLTIDEAGTWWASGHASNDSLIGQIFSSRDGVTWQPVPSKFEGSVLRLIRADGKLHALHYKHISVITEGGATKLVSMKDHILHAIVMPSVVVGLGSEFIGVLPAGAKRCKYGASPTGYGRYHTGVVPGAGFVLGDAKGLWFAPDAITWAPVPSFTGPVMAIVPSRSGAIVVSTRGEVFVVRS